MAWWKTRVRVAGSGYRVQYNAIQYNKNLFKHGKIVQYKKTTKTDLQDCRVGVTIDMDKDNNHL